MPELPEIETIKRGLQPKIVGQSIATVERLDSQPSQHPAGQFYVDEDQLNSLVIGARVHNVRRWAKVLIIDLSTSTSLIIHLKMTGQVLLVELDGQRFGGGHPTKSLIESLPDRSTRSYITFTNGSVLYFNDQRKFGWIRLVPTNELEELPFFVRIGPEPWSKNFTPSYLFEKLSRRSIAIKPAILDQTTVAGVGNIYADEALNLAKIDPRKPSNALTTTEVTRLRDAVPAVMEDSIKRGGTSFSNYVNHLGLTGDYLQHARVFKREGQPCPNCGHEIIKIKLSGRGTHFCPNCQK